ncbi:hypothetical protein SK128_004813 [Halocaridina rubra]|uniref:MADF domain-containing protein n=1 Tax=Halocaridina rubra TaxID=373956 RepID=A0AAN8WMV6_HALRR
MDDERIIAAVQRRSAIYDKGHVKNRNREAIKQYWKEIASELEVTEVEVIKKRWGYLRDYFVKQYKDLKVSQAGETPIVKRTKWALFNTMSFLIPVIEQNESVSTIKTEYKPKIDAVSEFEESEGEMSDDSFLAGRDLCAVEEGSCLSDNLHHNLASNISGNAQHTIRHQSFPGTNGKRPVITSYQSLRPKKMATTQLSELETFDDDDYFFKSLKPMLKELHQTQKLEFRIQVQNILLKFLKRETSP